MSPFRIGGRELWRARGPLAIVTLILTLQTMVVVGNQVTPDSLVNTREHYERTLHASDLEITFAAASAEEMPPLASLRAIPGVTAVARRFVQLGHVERGPERRVLPVLVVYLEPGADPVDELAVSRGAPLPPRAREAAVIDRGFARYQGVALGERLVVNPHSFPMRFSVVGIGLSPDFLVPTATPELLIPSRGSLGVVYAWRDQLDEIFVDPLYNQLSFRFAAGADPELTRRRVVAALGALQLERVVPRRANFGVRAVEESIRGPRVFIPVLALVLSLMAGAVAFVTTERLIARQRREIGALMAMGYSARHFYAGYLLLGLVPGLIGACLGSLAAVFYARAFAANLSQMAGLPEPVMRYGAGTFARGVAISGMVGLAAAALPLMRLLRLTPARAMRGGDEIQYRPLPRRLERLLGAAGPSARYALRNLFRRPRLSSALVALVAIAIAVPAALLTTQSTWMVWSEDWMGKVPRDATVTFKAGLEERAVGALAADAGLAAAEPFVQGACTLERPGRPSEELRLRGLAVPARLERIDLRSGRPFASADAPEVILNVAPGDPARLGDRVRLVVRGRAAELTVVGLASDLGRGTAEVPLETARRLLGLEGKASGMFVRWGRGPAAATPALAAIAPDPGAEVIDLEDPAEVAPRKDAGRPDARSLLLGHEMVSGVQAWADLHAALRGYLEEYRAIATPLIGLSGLMAFLSVLSLLGILLLERDVEVATLRSLGYGRAELGRMLALEIACYASAGLLLALPGWWVLAELLCGIMARTWFPIPSAYLASDLLTVVGPIAVCLAVTWAASLRGLLRLDLRATLAARAIG